MKLKYLFTMAAVLLVMLSLATVSAGENATDDAVGMDSPSGSSDVLIGDASSSDGTDVSVDLTVTDVYHGNKYNQAGDEIPWTITVKVNGTTASDVKVYTAFSSNLKYASHTPSVGTFNSKTGIWNIGDLKGSSEVSLTVFTKVLKNGRCKGAVTAETSSYDWDLSNNVCNNITKSGQGKIGGNVTQTTGNGANHYIPQGSKNNNGAIGRGQRGGSSGQTNGSASNGVNGKGSSSSNSNSVSKTILNSRNSDLLNNAAPSSSGSGSVSNSHDVANNAVKAIDAYDYTQIPLLVFAMFLIVMVTLVGVDKIKS